MKILLKNVSKYDDGDAYGNKCISVEGFNSRMHNLFYVCTGRMVEGLYGSENSIKGELEAWIEFLKTGYDEQILVNGVNQPDWYYICYKPQLLIAVTNKEQVDAHAALLAVGFEPSRAVSNDKYNDQYALTTWTYALNGFVEDKKEEE